MSWFKDSSIVLEIENEFLAIVHAINKFRRYITSYYVFVHTDNFAIKFLMNKYITSGRVT